MYTSFGIFLVVQWVKAALPLQGAQIQSLVRKLRSQNEVWCGAPYKNYISFVPKFCMFI